MSAAPESTLGFTPREVAQVAHNHLTLQILPHLTGRCKCRMQEGCDRALRRVVRFAAKVMEAHGAGKLP